MSNARAIAKLKDAQYGPLQSNLSKISAYQVTAEYPVCLHLNNLLSHTTATSSWIRMNTLVTGVAPAVMDSYTRGPSFAPRKPLHMDHDDTIPSQPNGDFLWKSTILNFKFEGWVDHTHCDVYIVQQKVRRVYDPWREETDLSPHGSFLPYTLPQFRKMSGPQPENWIPKNYKVIAHKKVYLDSIAARAPIGFVHGLIDAVTGLAADTVTATSAGQRSNPALPKTQHARYCQIKLTPNMLCKQLESNSAETDAEMTTDHNSNETGTTGPYSFDNFDPKQNLWAVVSTSDPTTFADGTYATEHQVRVSCQRYNVWRDTVSDHKQVRT